jgi:hypothetical protein
MKNFKTLCLFILLFFSGFGVVSAQQTPYQKKMVELTMKYIQILSNLKMSMPQEQAIKYQLESGGEREIERVLKISILDYAEKHTKAQVNAMVAKMSNEFKQAENLKNVTDFKREKEEKERKEQAAKNAQAQKEQAIKDEQARKAQEEKDRKEQAEREKQYKYESSDVGRIQKNIKEAFAKWSQKGEFEKEADYVERLRTQSKTEFDKICMWFIKTCFEKHSLLKYDDIVKDQKYQISKTYSDEKLQRIYENAQISLRGLNYQYITYTKNGTNVMYDEIYNILVNNEPEDDNKDIKYTNGDYSSRSLESMIRGYSDNKINDYILSPYNSEGEFFRLFFVINDIPSQEIKIHIPISQAENFKNNFPNRGEVDYRDLCFVENSLFPNSITLYNWGSNGNKYETFPLQARNQSEVIYSFDDLGIDNPYLKGYVFKLTPLTEKQKSDDLELFSYNKKLDSIAENYNRQLLNNSDNVYRRKLPDHNKITDVSTAQSDFDNIVSSMQSNFEELNKNFKNDFYKLYSGEKVIEERRKQTAQILEQQRIEREEKDRKEKSQKALIKAGIGVGATILNGIIKKK